MDEYFKPLKKQMIYIRISITIFFLVNISMLAISIYKITQNSFNIYDLEKDIYYVYIGILTLMLFISVIAIIGAKNLNNTCLHAYNISQYFLCLVFIGISIYSTIMGQQMINNMENNLNEIDNCNWTSQKNCNCGNYSNLSFIEYANDAIYQINNDIYGQQGQCKIKASNLQNQMYFILQGLPNVSQTSGVTSSLYCSEVKSQSQLMKYGNFMKYFEEKFKCSGMCSKTPFYTFSDINNGIPKQKCYQFIYQWLNNNQKFILNLTWSLSGYFFIQSLLSLFYMVKKATDIDTQKKAIIKEREPSFSHYKKLNYYEESYYYDN